MNIIKKLILVVLIFCTGNILAQDPHADAGMKKVIVQEVLQVKSYTYLKVLEEGELKWLAAPKLEAEIGEIFYYKGGMEMPNFESEELGRTFESVYFLTFITSESTVDIDKGMTDPEKASEEVEENVKAPTLDPIEVNLDLAEGGIRIGDLFKEYQKYNGQKVRIRGEVTKFNGSIMGRNWIHFQDGTSHEGAYDLMVTSQKDVRVGDQVIFEGLISLDKDFGAGYFYPIIMEEADLVE